MTSPADTHSPGQALVGEDLGVSDWLLVDQTMISTFGDLTKDPDPYHQNPEWAEQNSPYGGTIAYGFLTASLLSCFQKEVFGTYLSKHPEMMQSVQMPVNYGFDKLRFIAPVKCGARIRGAFTVSASTQKANGLLLTISATVEIENEDRPALVADWLFLLTGV